MRVVVLDLVFIEVEQAIFLRQILLLTFRKLLKGMNRFHTWNNSDGVRCKHLRMAVLLVEASKNINTRFQVFRLDEIWVGSLEMGFFKSEGVVLRRKAA